MSSHSMLLAGLSEQLPCQQRNLPGVLVDVVVAIPLVTKWYVNRLEDWQSIAGNGRQVTQLGLTVQVTSHA